MAYTPLTWKNVTPSDNSGIFEAMGEADEAAALGLQNSIDAISQTANNYQTRRTDEVVNDLLQFENRGEEADVFLKDIDTSWLDMSRITDTRKGLDADIDTIAMFAEKEDIKHKNKIKELDLQAKSDRIKAANKKNKPMNRGDLKASLSKRDTVDGNNPAISAPFMFFDSAAEDMDDTIEAYINNRGITDAKKQGEIRRFIFDDAVFDLDFLNEYFFSDGSNPDDNPFDHFDMLVKSRRKQYILDNAAANK